MAIQYKFPANKDNYEKLRTAKIILSNTVQHKYTYFMSQQRNGKKVLTRVRETNGHSFLDCKKLNKITEEWNKTEVPVGDYANTIKILKTSGLNSFAHYRSTLASPC